MGQARRTETNQGEIEWAAALRQWTLPHPETLPIRCALCGEEPPVGFCHVIVGSLSYLREPYKTDQDVIAASCGQPVLRKASDGSHWIDLKTGERAKFNFPGPSPPHHGQEK